MKSGEFPTEQAIPVCSTPASINAGFELLMALAVGCFRNLKQIVDTLTDMYYLGKSLGVSKFTGYVLRRSRDITSAPLERMWCPNLPRFMRFTEAT